LKLLTKTRRYYLSLFLSILAIWTIIFAVAFHYLMIDSVDEALINQKELIVSELKQQQTPHLQFSNELMSLKPVDKTKSVATSFSNIRMFSRAEKEEIPFRQYKTTIIINHHPYVLIIRKSLLEHDDLIMTILLTEVLLILLLFIGFYFVNNRILYQLWEPFYQTLKNIKQYNLASSGIGVEFPETDINEFQDLNKELERMIKKIRKDYINLKEFTENASHELQTPLSVIKSKIELIMQGELNKEGEIQLISDAYEATGKLAKLNQALLLLAKIENNQYQQHQEIDLTELLREKVDIYREFAAMRGLKLELDDFASVKLKMNNYLAEVLLNNLLSNSIKHNYEDGNIEYILTDESLIAKNTGYEPDIQPEKLFNRFQKSGNSQQSIGLGLAIVKAICDLYHFEIRYTFKNPYHIIEIKF